MRSRKENFRKSFGPGEIVCLILEQMNEFKYFYENLFEIDLVINILALNLIDKN